MTAHVPHLFSLFKVARILPILVAVGASLPPDTEPRTAEKQHHAAQSADPRPNNIPARQAVEPPAQEQAADHDADARTKNDGDPEADKLTKIVAYSTLAQAVIGLGTLFAAIGAAIYASRAAAENKRSADAALETLEGFIAAERAAIKFTSAAYKDAPDPVNLRGYTLKVRNRGRANGEIIQVRWQELAGPMWPKELGKMQWRAEYVQAGTDHHFAVGEYREMPETPIWLAMTIVYKTLSASTFETHQAWQVDFIPDDGLTSARYALKAHRCADMPEDT